MLTFGEWRDEVTLYYLQQTYKFVEKKTGVGGTGAGFGMELNREKRKCFVTEALNAAIVGVFEKHFPVLREVFWAYGKAMILRSDVAASRWQMNAGLILSPMAVFEFVGLCSGGDAHNLGAQTNSKSWDFAGKALLHNCDRLLHHGGVARTV